MHILPVIFLMLLILLAIRVKFYHRHLHDMNTTAVLMIAVMISGLFSIIELFL